MNQAIYDQAMKNGCTPRFAELLASRRVRLGVTDTAYFARFGRLGDELGPEHVKQVVAQAKKNGYTPSSTDVYLPNVARFPGDPQAFVSPSEGRAKMDRIAATRGMIRDGRFGMSYKYAESAEDPLANAPVIADDIVMREARHMAASDPEIAKASLSEIKAEVIKKRSPSKGKKSTTVKPAKG